MKETITSKPINRNYFIREEYNDLPFYTSRKINIKDIKIPNQRRYIKAPKKNTVLRVPYHIISKSANIQPQNIVEVQRTIIGLDTETIQGKCRLLADSKGGFVETRSFFDFVNYLTSSKFDKTLNMFYNLKYDIQAILSLLHKSDLYDLYTFGYTKIENLTLTYIPKKKFTIKIDKRNFKFYDIFQFYRSSLQQASMIYLNESKLDIDYADLERQEYWTTNFDTIVQYCIQDAVLCKKLGDLAMSQYNDLGLSFNNPISTASLAEQFAIRYSSIPRYQMKFAERMGYYSYRGGWFEQFIRGYIEEAYKYDLNSAYPEELRKLPDLQDGTWSRDLNRINESDFGFIFLRVKSKPNYVQPLSAFFSDSIKYPILNWHYRYLTLNEFKYFRDYDMIEYNLIDCALFFPNTNFKPFGYMGNFYDHRRELKDDNDKRQLAVKTLINATYGKTIQITENMEQRGTYKAGQLFLPSYASTITAGTRLKLLDLVLKYEIKPVAFYTDAVITTEKLPLHSKKLGAWDLEEVGELLSFGCGVYAMRNGDHVSNHIRGFRIDRNENLFTLSEKYALKSHIPIDQMRPVGLGEFVNHRQKYTDNHLNEWLLFSKSLDANFDKKRKWNYRIDKIQQLLTTSIDSAPLQY